MSEEASSAHSLGANNDRRRFLSIIGVTGLAGMTGCLADDDDALADESDDSTNDQDDETGGPFFEVTALAPGEEAFDQGSSVELQGEVTNTGTAPDGQTVYLEFNGEPLTEVVITLEPNESEAIDGVLEAEDTARLAPGEYDYRVFTEDDEQSAILTIREADLYTVLENPYETVDWDAVKTVRTQLHAHLYKDFNNEAHPIVDWYSGDDESEDATPGYPLPEADFYEAPWPSFTAQSNPVEWPWTSWSDAGVGENRDPTTVAGGVVATGLCEWDHVEHITYAFSSMQPGDVGIDPNDEDYSIDGMYDLCEEALLAPNYRDSHGLAGTGGLAIPDHPSRYYDPGEEDRYGDLYTDFSREDGLVGWMALTKQGGDPWRGDMGRWQDTHTWDWILTNTRPDVWAFACDDPSGGMHNYAETMDRRWVEAIIDEDDWDPVDDQEGTQEATWNAFYEGRIITCQRAPWHDADDLHADRPPVPNITTIEISQGEITIDVATEPVHIEWISGFDPDLDPREDRGRVIDTGQTFDIGEHYDELAGYVRAHLIMGTGPAGSEEVVGETLLQPFVVGEIGD